jgi:undecaprenyl-diphosphatase
MGLGFIALLALVQGLTEFLPVSSSGHLVLLPQIIGTVDQGLLIDVALHVGTLLAIIVYYHKDITKMVLAVLFYKKNHDVQSRNLAFFIIIATIPAVLFGLFLHLTVPEGIRDVRVIIVTTIFFALLMAVADLRGRQEKEVKDITLKAAVLIGIAQAIALIPGTSRSGITMTTARFLNFKRVDAARFSFLLGMPAMAAAGTLGFLEIFEKGDLSLLTDALYAVVLAFFAGLAAIHFMMKYLTRFGLMPFVVYRLALATLLIYLYMQGHFDV